MSVPAVSAVPSLAPAERVVLVEQRLDAVRRVLAEAGAEAVLLESRHSFAWLTVGGLNHVVLASEKGAAPLLITRQRAAVLAPVNEAPRLAEEELAGLPLVVEALDWWDREAPGQRARALAAGSEPLVEEHLAEPLAALRPVLAAAEHERLGWLGGLVAQCLDEALAGVASGSTEHELAADATARLAAHGVRSPVVLVAADERIERYRHPLPTQAPIRRRVMLVLVGEAWGLHAALTGFRELEPPPPELSRRVDATHGILAAMLDATRPGRTLGDVLAVAQGAYAEHGFADEWRLHHQGGSIGYQGRERIAAPGDPTPIRAGMAFAWNPSVRGAKAEETFYLDEAGQPRLVTALEEP